MLKVGRCRIHEQPIYVKNWPSVHSLTGLRICILIINRSSFSNKFGKAARPIVFG